MDFKSKIPKFDRFTTVKVGKLAALGFLYGQGPKRVAARVAIELVAAGALYSSVLGGQQNDVDRYYHDRETQNYKLRYILLEKNVREYAKNTNNAEVAAALRTLIHRSDLEAQS